MKIDYPVVFVKGALVCLVMIRRTMEILIKKKDNEHKVQFLSVRECFVCLHLTEY